MTTLNAAAQEINNFYKEHGKTKFPIEFKANGKCHIGNKKDCRYHDIKNGKEICKRGWCLAK